MMLGVLNLILDDDAARRVVRQLLVATPPGSHLVLTHPTVELGGEGNVAAMKFWNENATPRISARGREEVTRFFDGLELLEPGPVSCTRRRPEPTAFPEPAVVPRFGAVARRP